MTSKQFITGAYRMDSTITTQTLVPPTAIKVRPTPMAMPPEVRLMIIKHYFHTDNAEVQLHLVNRHGRDYVPKRLGKLAVATVNKQLNEEVMDYVFGHNHLFTGVTIRFREVLFATFREATGLFHRIRQLHVERSDLRYFRVSKARIDVMLPSLEKLSTSSSCALSDVVVQKQVWQDKRFVER
jgi:hypothetical protein